MTEKAQATHPGSAVYTTADAFEQVRAFYRAIAAEVACELPNLHGGGRSVFAPAHPASGTLVCSAQLHDTVTTITCLPTIFEDRA